MVRLKRVIENGLNGDEMVVVRRMVNKLLDDG